MADARAQIVYDQPCAANYFTRWSKKLAKRELNERVANKITEFALAVRDTLLEGSFYHVKKIAPVCAFRFDAILLIHGEGASNIIFFFYVVQPHVIAKYLIK